MKLGTMPLPILSGLPLSEAKPGDIGVCHSKGLFGWLIRLGTWSRWNHVVVFETIRESQFQTIVIQAAAKGVSRAYLDQVAPGGEIRILRCPEGVDRDKVVARARAELGARYGFVSILSIAITILSPKFLRLDFRRAGTLICSALGALCLITGGWMEHVPDIYQWTPGDTAKALGA